MSDKKFGSKFKQRRFDSYHAPEQEHGSAEPEKRRELDAEPKDSSVPKNEHAESVNVSAPHEVVKQHGPATEVEYRHNHVTNEHKVTSTHEDGHKNESVHSSAAEAYETGGDLASTDVKRRTHPDQQGAEPEEMNYLAPETA